MLEEVAKTYFHFARKSHSNTNDIRAWAKKSIPHSTGMQELVPRTTLSAFAHHWAERDTSCDATRSVIARKAACLTEGYSHLPNVSDVK
jgi:hypothetical protein